jgi:DNA-binding MarR family transcriptional regulator
MLDEKIPPLIDHFGWRLWLAARRWKAEFDHRMAIAGYPWFTEARSGLIARVGSAGAAQSELARALRTSKQAVQQLIDELTALGAVERAVSPNDARSRIIRVTPKGVAAAKAANAAKVAIQAEARKRLGPRRFDAMFSDLVAWTTGETTGTDI